MSASPEWLLFIGRDPRDESAYCPGSRVCLRIVDQEQLPDDVVAAQDCEVLRSMPGGDVPPMVTGTPTLVLRSDPTQLYCGTEALTQLLAISRARILSPPRPATRRERTEASTSSSHKERIDRGIAPSSVRYQESEGPRVGPGMGDGGGDEFDSETKDRREANRVDDLFGMLVDEPVQEDAGKTKRVTESDVQRYMEQRNAKIVERGSQASRA